MGNWTKSLDEPTMALDPSRLDDLELLLGGLYGPARAYNLPGNGSSGSSLDVQLKVPRSIAEVANVGGGLLLTDTDGTPLARLGISETQTTANDCVFLAGSVEALQPAEHSPGRGMRITQPVKSSESQDRPLLVAAFSSRPHADEISSVVLRAATDDALLWLVAVSLTTDSHGLLDLLDELQRCESLLANVRAGLLVVPGYATPTAQLSQSRGQFVLSQLGADDVLDFTRVKELDPFDNAGSRRRRGRQGLVVLFSGLSGSGKSTLARALSEHFLRLDDKQVTLLDGDDVRRFLTAGLGFSREDRNTNVERIGWVAGLIANSGGIAICAPIAPFEESRRRFRQLAETGGEYVLVHVSTPLETCEKRDRKGLYAKARAGQIPEFTGIDSPYEAPLDADYIVNTAVTSVHDAISDLVTLIRERSAWT